MNEQQLTRAYSGAADALLEELQRRRDEQQAIVERPGNPDELFAETAQRAAERTIATGQVIGLDSAIALVRIHLPGIEGDARDEVVAELPDEASGYDWSRERGQDEAHAFAKERRDEQTGQSVTPIRSLCLGIRWRWTGFLPATADDRRCAECLRLASDPVALQVLEDQAIRRLDRNRPEVFS